jgi:hypothetical protein
MPNDNTTIDNRKLVETLLLDDHNSGNFLEMVMIVKKKKPQNKTKSKKNDPHPDDPHIPDQEMTTNIDENVFAMLLKRFLESGSSKGHSKKFYREYRVSDLIYRVNMQVQDTQTSEFPIQDIRVIKMDTCNAHTMNIRSLKKHDFVALVSNRQKVSPHIFPCTTNMHDKSYVNVVSFKVHHRIFINFEHRQYCRHDAHTQTNSSSDGENNVGFGVYRISLTYTHQDKVDTTYIDNEINRALDLLTGYIANGIE